MDPLSWSKTVLVVVYLVTLLLACGTPFALQTIGLRPLPFDRWLWRGLNLALFTCAAALLWQHAVLAPMSPILLAMAFLLPLLGRPWPRLLGGLIAIPLLAGVMWWAPLGELGVIRALCFVLAGLVAMALCRWQTARRGVGVIPTSLLLVAAAAFLMMSGALSNDSGLIALWHHWSVYIAAAEAALAGAIPYRDFPLQYGAGPLLVAAAACHQDCWTGMYWAVYLTNLLYLITLGGCVVLLMRGSPRGFAWVALGAMVSSVVLWTGYPPDFVGSMLAPSVVGFRFLPLSALLIWIIAAETHALRVAPVGHALWFVGVFWSPEAAFYASVVWWPYLAVRHAQANRISRIWPVLFVAIRGAGLAALAFGLAMAVLALVFFGIFGQWPLLQGFTIYIRNPPGPLPANPLGPIWLLMGTALIGLLALTRADPRRVRTATACILALVAVTSYYLGRSHDNNALNLFPFMVLVATAAAAIELPGVAAGFIRVVLCGVIAWSATFGVPTWRQAFARGEAWQFGPAPIVNRIRFVSPDAWAMLDTWFGAVGMTHAKSSDLGAALSWLRQRGAGSAVWANDLPLLPYGPADGAWTGMNDIGANAFLPANDIDRFIRHGAQDIHRPGWILVDTTQPTPWLADFTKYYAVTEQHPFGQYIAYYLTPR